MSLLIKALDKAQEEAQAAKGKQPKAKRTEQAETNREAKRQPALLNPAVTEPNLSLSSAASEKIAAANALELELSPTIKTSNTEKPAISIQIRSEKSGATQAQHNAIDTAKLANNGLENTASASKTVASAKSNDSTAATKTNAANVFAAKRIEASHQNSTLAFIVGVGALVLLAIAAYFYQWAESESDLTFVAQRPAMAVPNTQQATASSLPATTAIRPATSANAQTEVYESTVLQNATEAGDTAAQKMLKAESAINALRLAQNEKAFDVAETESESVKGFKEPKQSALNLGDTEQIASKSASIQVSRSTEQIGVNPNLMRAYDAYNAGNDSEAIKLYKQVLQRDVRNVDALLGLGAIAQRQGRLQDANGWYAKVLELDPKNSIALNFNLAASVDNQAPNDVNTESRIKNMLAKQPDDANLHATLGNFYADSRQWTAAQQAYFDAYRLNASAENAFNLAISLDQLGKPKLALPYYQRALQLSQSTDSGIDKAALEARIAAIE